MSPAAKGVAQPRQRRGQRFTGAALDFYCIRCLQSHRHSFASYSLVLFDACDGTGRQIYHTNVMMSIGSGWAVVCRDAIVQNDRARVLQALSEGGRRVVELSLEQVGAWCHATRHPSRVTRHVLSLSLSLADVLLRMQHLGAAGRWQACCRHVGQGPCFTDGVNACICALR